MTFPEFFNKDGGEFAKAVREGQPFKEIVRDQDKLYLRVASVFDVGQEKLTVVTGEPLDRNLLSEIAANLGEITLYAAGIGFDETPQSSKAQSGAKGNAPPVSLSSKPEKKQDGFVIGGSEAAAKAQPGQQVLRPTFTVGALAAPSGLMDREITFATPLPVIDWNSGRPGTSRCPCAGPYPSLCTLQPSVCRAGRLCPREWNTSCWRCWLSSH